MSTAGFDLVDWDAVDLLAMGIPRDVPALGILTYESLLWGW
jgi:hypothetical protein